MSIPEAVVSAYFAALEQDSYDSWKTLDELLDRHPELARISGPNGELPLRIAMRQPFLPGRFRQLVELGAEHDIFTACAEADLRAVERLLNSDSALVNAIDEEGNTPLHWACDMRFSTEPRDSVGLVRLLLAAGASVDALNKYQETPLQCSLLRGEAATSAFLLENGAEPDILFAVVTEDFELLAEICATHPQSHTWSDPRDGATLLHIAVESDCSPRMLEHLLTTGMTPFINTCSRKGWTPLAKAMSCKHFEAARILVEHGADIATRRTFHKRLGGVSVLRSAIHNDCTQLAEMVIARGADVHERSDRRPPLCDARSEQMVELLISAGADLRCCDSNDCAPLDFAIEEGRVEAARALVRHGAPATFFVHVMLNEHDRVREMLVRHPELIRAYNLPTATAEMPPLTDDDDNVEIPWGSAHGTALHYAVKSGVPSMVQLLLDYGADVNARTKESHWTPLHDATYYGIYNDLPYGHVIIRMLVSAGADLNSRTRGGYRPINIASYLSFRDRAASIFDLLNDLTRQSR